MLTPAKGEGPRRAGNADVTVLLGLIKVRQIRAQDLRWAGLQGFTLRLSVQLDSPRSHSLSLQSHAATLLPFPRRAHAQKHTHCLTVSGRFSTHCCLAAVPAANFIILAAANVSGSDCTEGLLCGGLHGASIAAGEQRDAIRPPARRWGCCAALFSLWGWTEVIRTTEAFTHSQGRYV